MTILGPEKLALPIGTSDYKKLRRANLTYVDKTTFIASVLGTTSEAQLFPRPRRFGKTLNISSLQYFLEESDEDLTDIFEDTYVWTAEGGRFRKHFQQHAVIALSFKEVKETTWEEAWENIRGTIRDEIDRLRQRYPLDAYVAKNENAALWLKRASEPDAPPGRLKKTLKYLIQWLTAVTKHPPILLIDEYDAPLHTAFEHGYWTEALGFFRSFYSGGLKDEKTLFRGVLTGILRIVKANTMSGLNNTDDFNIFYPDFATDFGFTETEVAELAERAGPGVDMQGLKNWYNGYQFGTPPVTIYNPWSVSKYLKRPHAGFQSHWKHSSDNAMIRAHLVGRMEELGPQIHRLIAGETISAVIQDNVFLDELRTRRSLIWSLLTFSGYLTKVTAEDSEDGRHMTLRIPNKEVRAIFKEVFSIYLEEETSVSDGLRALTDAMLRGDATAFRIELAEVLKSTMSYFDFGTSRDKYSNAPRKPIEAIYQAFIVGLLLRLQDRYHVRSNREAAYGRADVLIIPRTPGDPGAVLELKVVKDGVDEDVPDALRHAVEQIRAKAYMDQVQADGAGQVFGYGVVFDGKRVWVEEAVGGRR